MSQNQKNDHALQITTTFYLSFDGNIKALCDAVVNGMEIGIYIVQQPGKKAWVQIHTPSCSYPTSDEEGKFRCGNLVLSKNQYKYLKQAILDQYNDFLKFGP